MTSSSESDAPPVRAGPPPVPGPESAKPAPLPRGEIPAWSRKYIGREIGFRFRIDKALAVGGMGSIFLGEQTNMSRQVAIKLVRTSDVDTIQRMRHEARSLAAVNHPAIVEVYDFIAVTGSRASDCYLVMGYVPGSDLEVYLGEVSGGFLPPAEAVRLLVPTASALVELHARGIIHRDLKLANIIRFVGADGSARTKLVDFGFARGRQDPSLTAKGIVVGTPAYFAPELVLGSGHSPASDVYAFGVTLCKLLTGESPYGAVALGDLLQKAVHQSVALPIWLMSTPLGPLVQAMLSREPQKRPTMREVLVGLEECLGALSDLDVLAGAGVVPKAESETEPVVSHQEPGRERGRGRGGSASGLLRASVWGLGGLCVVLMAAVIFFIVRWSPKASSSGGTRPARSAMTAPITTPMAKPVARRAVSVRPAHRARPPLVAPGRPTSARPGARPRLAGSSGLPSVAEIRRGCKSQATMRHLFHRARKIVLGKMRGNLEHARRILAALLPAKCTPNATRHWVSYYLTMAYVRQGRCGDARRAWSLYERDQVRRRGRRPSFPACP
jgi:eukaryotic-like serine/threonine-protein kinase